MEANYLTLNTKNLWKKKKKQVDVLIYAPNNFVPNVLMEL